MEDKDLQEWIQTMIRDGSIPSDNTNYVYEDVSKRPRKSMFDDGTFVFPEEQKKPGIHELRRDAHLAQGSAMMDAMDMETWLGAMMDEETAELISYAAGIPGGLSLLKNLFKKGLKREARDALVQHADELKTKNPMFQPKTPRKQKFDFDLDMDDKTDLRPYKPKAERQLDSAVARMRGVLLDDDDLDVDLIPYVPKKK